MELQDRWEELQAQGLGVAAISFDSEAVLAEFSERRGITFPLLADEGSKVITEFGILNTVALEALEVVGPGGRDPTSLDPAFEEDIGKYVTFGASTSIGFHVGTPFSGTFMLDRTGRVTSRFFEEFYRERNTTANIMLKLGAGLAPIAAVEGSTAHLKFTAYPSDPYVNPGSRFSVAVRVEPNPDIHVYAPGAETMGYRVVSLNLRPVPHVRLSPDRIQQPLHSVAAAGHIRPTAGFVVDTGGVPIPKAGESHSSNLFRLSSLDSSEPKGHGAGAAPILPSDPCSQLLPFRIVLGLPSYPTTMHGCPSSIGMKRILQKQALHRVPSGDKPHYDLEIPTRFLFIPIRAPRRNGGSETPRPRCVAGSTRNSAFTRIEKYLLHATAEEVEIHLRLRRRRAGGYWTGRRGFHPFGQDLPFRIVLGLPKLAADMVFGASRFERERLAKKTTVLREAGADQTRNDLVVVARSRFGPIRITAGIMLQWLELEGSPNLP